MALVPGCSGVYLPAWAVVLLVLCFMPAQAVGELLRLVWWAAQALAWLALMAAVPAGLAWLFLSEAGRALVPTVGGWVLVLALVAAPFAWAYELQTRARRERTSSEAQS